MSDFWLWREIDLKMRTRFYKKILLGYFILWSASRCVYFIRPLTLFYSVSFYFVPFSCTAQIHKLKFKSEYYLRINIGSRVKNANTGNHTLISWTMLIGFIYFKETTRQPRYVSCKIRTFYYYVSLSCIVQIYILTITIFSQKYRDLSVQVEIGE